MHWKFRQTPPVTAAAAFDECVNGSGLQRQGSTKVAVGTLTRMPCPISRKMFRVVQYRDPDVHGSVAKHCPDSCSTDCSVMLHIGQSASASLRRLSLGTNDQAHARWLLLRKVTVPSSSLSSSHCIRSRFVIFRIRKNDCTLAKTPARASAGCANGAGAASTQRRLHASH